MNMRAPEPASSEYSFESSRWRLFGETLVLSQIATLVLATLGLFMPSASGSVVVSWSRWFSITLAALVVGGIGALVVAPFRVTVTSESVTGPGRWGRATTIRLVEIDRVATLSRPAWRWLSGYHIVFGPKGSQVRLHVLLFGPAKVRRILDLLGCSNAGAV
jgi:hypothetical protein